MEWIDANGAKTGETPALAAGDQVSVYDYSEPSTYVYATTASGAVLAGCVKATAVLPKTLVNKPEDLGPYLSMENMGTDMSGID